MKNSDMEPIEEYSKIQSIYIRHRNCLAIKGKFAPVFTDYYLNLMQHGITQHKELDGMLKELLAYFTLHMVARPWKERQAWTVTLRTPRCNLFVTGSSWEKSVVGRVFTENVRETDHAKLFVQTYDEQTEARTSSIALNSNMPAEWVEDYYIQSEQRMARCVELPDEEFVLVVAQPGSDIEWMADLTREKIMDLEDKEETKLLETREFRFHCGCTLQKVLPALGSWRNRLDELFSGEPSIEITCPRCAARYQITPDMI